MQYFWTEYDVMKMVLGIYIRSNKRKKKSSLGFLH